MDDDHVLDEVQGQERIIVLALEKIVLSFLTRFLLTWLFGI